MESLSASEKLQKHYDPKLVEHKWQEKWLKSKEYLFDKKTTNKPTFVIDTPPPFTSGRFHIGRAYGYILSDVTVRYKRMRGYNVLLPQGWEPQGLPLELAVETKLKISPDNIDMFRDLSRKWARRMIRQMRHAMTRLGYIPDWSYEYKTMDDDYHEKVQFALLNLYNMGRIYRSKHPIPWCPKCKTALASAELGYKEREANLIYVKFKLESGLVEIATTRPELLHSCVAVAFHPKDKRYQYLVGNEAHIPIYDRSVPIIMDESVETVYGTGLVMVCTFGDERDVKTVLMHKLPTIEAFDNEGRIINSGKYDGLSIGEARKAILTDLSNIGALSRNEKIRHNVLTHTERSLCQTPIEFLSKPQWFIHIMDLKEEIVRSAHQIKWSPPHMKKRLIDWAEGLEWDWLISRQRKFGTPLPFWYCQGCGYIIAPNKENLPVDAANEKPPVDKCPSCGNETIRGAEEVCDCWVDSSITPLVVAGWPDNRQYSPRNLRQHGSDVTRTWDLYSIVQCHLQVGQLPCERILVNGMILGTNGRAMSSSLGNTIDPLEVVGKYGADSLRQALLLVSIGSDFSFEWKDAEYCYLFIQKFWNACRFAQGHLAHYEFMRETPKLHMFDKGILSLLQQLIKTFTENMEAFRFDIALKEFHSFVWHEFCNYYLELVKHRLYTPLKGWMKKSAQYTLYMVLWTLIRLFAPFAPHLTEEISQCLFNKTALGADWPTIDENMIDEEAENAWKALKEAVSTVRKSKSQQRIQLDAEIPEVTIHCENENSKRILGRLRMDIKEIVKAKRVVIVTKAEE